MSLLMLLSAIAFSQEAELERVDLGDGLWSYELPPSFEPDLLVEGNIITWRYDGQVIFDEKAQRISGPQLHREPLLRPVEKTRTEKLKEMVRVDSMGRRWRVEDVDEVAWDEAIAAYDAEYGTDADEYPIRDKTERRS